MNRVVRAVELVALSVGLVAGCQSMKNDTAKMENKMGMSTMAVAHMHAAGAASTQPAMENVTGDVVFTQKGDKVMIHADLTGLPPGAHGIHIHEKGDLTAADLSSAGAHYDPDHHDLHGAPNTSAMVHAGDLGNITADSSGHATFDLTVTDLSVGGKNNVIGHSVIIHAKEDDLHTQKSGNSGARIAGGVIEAGK